MHSRYRYSLLLVVVLAAFVGTGWAGGASSAFFSDSEASTGSIQAAERFPYFLVTIDGTNSPVTEGEPLHVNATITNNGSVAATQQLRLNVSNQTEPVDTREVASQELKLEANRSKTVTLTWNTSVGDGERGNKGKEYNVTVLSDDEAATTSVFVREETGNGTGGKSDCPGKSCE